MPIISAAISAVSAAATAIGSFVSGLGFFGKIALSFGLNAVLGAIGKKEQPKPQGGTKIEVERGPDIPRQVAIGIIGAAGHDVYTNTYGKANARLQQIRVLQDWPSPVDGLLRVALDGKWITLKDASGDDASFGKTPTTGKWENEIFFKFYNGTQTVADPNLVSHANPAERWTSQHIGRGICFVIVTADYNLEDNRTQLPQLLFEFKGAVLYDWRLDSTAGGSGSHRWGQIDTYEWSENPIVAEYNYRRGFSLFGDLFCGMGMTASDLPLPRFTAAANLCDELIGERHRYAVSLFLDCMMQHGDNIRALMLSCGGMTVNGVDGSFPIVGSNQPVVATIYDRDLDSRAPESYTPLRSMSKLVNRVSGQFASAKLQWAMGDYVSQKSDIAISNDRRTRDAVMNFPMVRYKPQAEQLASIYLKENRFEATASITLRPRFQVLEPGDWIRWVSPRFSASGGEKVFLVTETALASLDDEGPRCITVQLQERSGTIYGNVTADDLLTPIDNGLPDFRAELSNFQVIGVWQQGEDGRRAAAIRATWDLIDDPTITRIVFYYRPVAQPDVIMSRTEKASKTSKTLDSVVGQTDFEVSYILESNPPRKFFQSAWYSVRTPSSVVGYYELSAQIRTELGLITNEADGSLQSFRNELDGDIDDLAVLINSKGVYEAEQREVIRQQIVSSNNQVAGLYDNLVSVVLAGDAATVTRVEQLITTNNYGTAAALESFQQSYTSGQSAMAQDVTKLYARNDLISASGFIKFDTAADGPNGRSRFQIWLNAGTRANPNWGKTGFLMEVWIEGGTVKSQIVMITNKFVLATTESGGTSDPVFFVVNNKIYMSNAFVANLDTENLKIGGIDFRNLAIGAIAQRDSWSASTTSGQTSDWITLRSFSIDNKNKNGSPVIFEYDFSGNLPGINNFTRSLAMRLRNLTTGTVLASRNVNTNTANFSPAIEVKDGLKIGSLAVDVNSLAVEYKIETGGGPNLSSNISTAVTGLWWNR